MPTINSTFYNYERKQEKRVNHEWIKNLLVDFCHSHARMRAVSLLKSFFLFSTCIDIQQMHVHKNAGENTFSCIKTRKAYESPKKVFNVMRTSCCLTALLLRVHYRMYFLIICIHNTSTFSQYFIFFYFFLFTAGLKMCTQISIRKIRSENAFYSAHKQQQHTSLMDKKDNPIYFQKVDVIVFYFHTIQFCISCGIFF